MAAGQLEIERKFEPEPEFRLPDLAGLDGVAAVGEPVEHALEATYFDTADLRLARARITLRRRTGGPDEGWHLKLPAAAGARTELHSPLGQRRSTPPKAVLEPVMGLLRGAPACVVAVLRTRRVVVPLLDAEGRELAEVADDTVTATAPGPGSDDAATVLSWRELEVELVEGGEELLEAVAAALAEAGARPAAHASKLARVLAERPGPSPTPAEAGSLDGGKRKKRKRPAGAVVLAALRSQLDALQQADLALRTGSPDGVHDLRVACRRLRSILAAFRPVLDRERTDPVREELRWIGGQLSAARDGEVAMEHLRRLVDAQPPELVLGPVAARLQQAAADEAATGRRRTQRTLSDRRYLAALDALHDLLADPPLTGRAGDPAGPVLAEAVRRTGRRLRRRVETARERAGDADGQHALHEVRKAAKRVRYTAEVAAPVLGAAAEALADCAEQVQDVLGAAQDTEATRNRCLQLGRAAAAAREEAWTYGRLHGLEEARAERSAEAFWRLEPALRPAVKAAVRAG